MVREISSNASLLKAHESLEQAPEPASKAPSKEAQNIRDRGSEGRSEWTLLSHSFKLVFSCAAAAAALFIDPSDG